MLTNFRDPARIDHVIASLANEGFSRSEAQLALRTIADHGYVIEMGDRAVSVVCEYGWKVYSNEQFEDFPGGSFLNSGARFC